MSTSTRAPKAPAGLTTKGRKLWNDVVKTYELRVDELRVLEEACRESDLVDELDAELAHRLKNNLGLTTSGSTGQTVMHPLVGEIRAHRATLSRLLKDVGLPDDDAGDAAGKRSAQARAAVNERWRRGAVGA